MIYLLDANVLITAHNTYYPVDVVPEFWTWLTHHSSAGNIKMPIETFEEVTQGGTDETKDLLFAWVQQENNKAALLLPQEVDAALVRVVINEGYAPDLTDDQIDQLARDPFLIAHALSAPAERCVVTTEVSSRKKKGQNRKIPDVCEDLGVLCCDPFLLLRTLRFSTDWARRR